MMETSYKNVHYKTDQYDNIHVYIDNEWLFVGRIDKNMTSLHNFAVAHSNQNYPIPTATTLHDQLHDRDLDIVN